MQETIFPNVFWKVLPSACHFARLCRLSCVMRFAGFRNVPFNTHEGHRTLVQPILPAAPSFASRGYYCSSRAFLWLSNTNGKVPNMCSTALSRRHGSNIDLHINHSFTMEAPQVCGGIIRRGRNVVRRNLRTPHATVVVLWKQVGLVQWGVNPQSTNRGTTAAWPRIPSASAGINGCPDQAWHLLT
jgi:hypothetical protein